MGNIVKLGPNPDMTGATESSAGAHGLVPVPAAGDQNKFLRGDGSWGTTPYPSNMGGATAQYAGTAGLVPAPAAGAQGKFLKGNGTWGDGLSPDDIVNNLTTDDATKALSAAMGKELNSKITSYKVASGSVTVSDLETALNSLHSSMNDSEVRNIRFKISTASEPFAAVDYLGTIRRMSSSYAVVSVQPYTGVGAFITGRRSSSGSWSWESLRNEMSSRVYVTKFELAGNASKTITFGAYAMALIATARDGDGYETLAFAAYGGVNTVISKTLVTYSMSNGTLTITNETDWKITVAVIDINHYEAPVTIN